MKVLVVVDMQKDFTYGALKNEDAIKIIPEVKKYIKAFDGEVVFTLDTHSPDYLDTQEGKYLPVTHCVADSDGWQLVDELMPLAEGKRIVTKPTFGSIDLACLLADMDDEEPIDEVTLIGICTDICVISNAMIIKATLPETPIKVVANLCAGVTPQSHQTALDAMKACQIDIV